MRSPSAGGHGRKTERRHRYGNDLGSDVTLVGVTARWNRQKSDLEAGPGGALPGHRCVGGHQAPLGPAVDQAEREALLSYAAGCPNANLAFERAG
ncbi:hypothetical protein Snoj_29830 [Streptomyces nojiriensis]|uniref:Uncharacterized protein n=1 Tax=Streptomyces nojiriensis TaxID=66374 RepID=A0ABQ3SLQ1_9ACTN|nr:hypothetical protein [Streptomyces nojiriensis]QTI42650.1 hypothetical protein JYK04_00409 [Streptomyces nojiriensis]GGS15855.1 hypothetical protein GCM10010205_52010 [Streptomyces nojiriensis]GHI69065.1 hypothetical protein Snoj_29830 [Streptomyces nojiriensis]